MLSFSSVMCLAATIGAGASQNYAGHMTARIFQGLSSGVSESLLPLILTDITFVSDRGRIFAIYWTAQSILSSIFGISGPYIAASSSWRSYYWVCKFVSRCRLNLTSCG
jgi:MFS family permease